MSLINTNVKVTAYHGTGKRPESKGNYNSDVNNLKMNEHTECETHGMDSQSAREEYFGQSLSKCYDCKNAKKYLRKKPIENFWTRRADTQKEWIAQMLERQETIRFQRKEEEEKNAAEHKEYERKNYVSY